MSRPLSVAVNRLEHKHCPEHHIVALPNAKGWTSYLPSWPQTRTGTSDPRSTARVISRTSTERGSSDSGNVKRSRTWKRQRNDDDAVGFRNPWPSWHKPTRMEVWQALEWGTDTDPCIDLAASHVIDRASPKSSGGSSNDEPSSRKEQAAQLLTIMKPDFEFTGAQMRSKATWLGHAGVLVQLQPLESGSRPVRCLFDPMFSMRASPMQSAGPLRTYVPPCSAEDLPEIDAVMISHNHFDHLDYDTIVSLWKLHAATIRFIVPLGNRKWFVDCGIDGERVTELDWWDSATLEAASGTAALKITCTPAQHNSGRSAFDVDATLWSSWYVERVDSAGQPYRVFFAGDTGFQFHESPGWPPPPPPPTSLAERTSLVAGIGKAGSASAAKYPACPAFQEIYDRLGLPDLLFLPVAVGATYDFLRSFAPVPDSVNPIPRHSPGVTAHNHMPPWDAVRVLKILTGDAKQSDERSSKKPVAIAMHWGTFVTDPTEVLKTLGQLEWACDAHAVQFGRTMDAMKTRDAADALFLALNHGESVTLE
jgi:N-acyl-phosphatidylethanolamine-hydrolysing phospholipase D